MEKLAAPWFRGINSVLVVARTGIYGGVNELGWAIADGVVGPSVLFQREVVTATDPGAVIDGVSVDVDDVLAPDFGQWDLPR